VYGYQLDSTGTKCLGRAQPGTLALRDVVRLRFQNVQDWGTYSCRQTSTGSSLSTHAEGRGWDAGFPRLDHPEGTRLAGWLVEKAPMLGVQRVIWMDRQWDARARAWRAYGKTSNNNTLRHRDHVHVELCWAAAKNLTRTQVEAAFGKEWDDMATRDEIKQAVTEVVAHFREVALVQKDGKGPVYANLYGHCLVHVRNGDAAHSAFGDWSVRVQKLPGSHGVWSLPVVDLTKLGGDVTVPAGEVVKAIAAQWTK
jgi:hypothetical protein